MQVGAEERFGDQLRRLAPDGRIGLAVSGGPDSLALLLLAAAAVPGRIEAATVDHGLRADSATEARMVAERCAALGVPHGILKVTVEPGASLQAKAREARYAAVTNWAQARGLTAVATGHHRDDQAETLLMRLARGSGAGGLAGMREDRPLAPGIRLIRPLLGFRKAELVAVVEAAGVDAVDDPANADPRHDRTRARALLRDNDWLEPERLARSATALSEAEEALRFCADRLVGERIRSDGEALEVDSTALPREFQRRLLLLAMARLRAPVPRGPDLDRALDCLRGGRSCTLAGLKLSGGSCWRLETEPPRRA